MEKETYIKTGDLIIFDDKQYLYCGDSTDEGSYRFLKEEATMTLTSPPYNIGEKMQKYLDSVDDFKKRDGYYNLSTKVMENCLNRSKYVFWNVAHISGNKIPLIDLTYKYKDNFCDTIIWVKDTSQPAILNRVMNSDFEYIYIYIANNTIIGKLELVQILEEHSRMSSTKREIIMLSLLIYTVQLCL